VLRIRDVCKSYGGVVALDGVSLEIAAGEILGLLGPNGAGKTTLISLIAGLTPPDRGSVTVDGFDVETHPMQVKRMLGVVPQELGIYLQLTVEQNLRFFGRLVGLRRNALDERIDSIAEALDLSTLRGRCAQELSGGQKRRLHTAMALLQHSRLLLLDEPTAGVDVDTRTRLLAYIRDLASEGTAICYATHYLQEVESLGASVAILENGQLTSRGTLAEMIAASEGALVEIRMEDPLPRALNIDGRVADEDDVLRIATTDPSTAVITALSGLGEQANRIQSIEIVQPSLESAYMALTGRRFDANTAAAHRE
jgi:ABC-2 type transport system ATP-binding protein